MQARLSVVVLFVVLTGICHAADTKTSSKLKSAPSSSLFLAQVRQVTEKAELCIRSGKRESGHCADFSSYHEAMFKGSTAVWTDYHIDNGDINDKNYGKVMTMLKKSGEALSVGMPAQ